MKRRSIYTALSLISMLAASTLMPAPVAAQLNPAKKAKPAEPAEKAKTAKKVDPAPSTKKSFFDSARRIREKKAARDKKTAPLVVRTYGVGKLLAAPLDRPLPGVRPSGFSGAGPSVNGDRLFELIENTVEPASWEEDGGRGTIELVGSTLVVSQTEAVHAILEQVVGSLEARAPAALRIRVHWLFPTRAETLPMLLSTLTPAEGATPETAYPSELLAELISTAPGVHAETIAYENQTVHLIAGDRRRTSGPATPVVTAKMATFDVTTYLRNDGAAIQITPRLTDDARRVAVDLHSFVSRPSTDRKPVRINLTGNAPHSEVPISRMLEIPVITRNVTRTTISIPRGKPHLVSATTVNPRTEGGDRRLLCLVIQADRL